MNLSATLDELMTGLTADPPAFAEVPVLIGLDGYVDKIQKVVQSQQGAQSSYFSAITAFAERIRGAAGVSAQLELVTQETKPGGNAPIMAHALASLGIPNYCLGNFGFPQRHPVFAAMHPLSRLISLGPPAETNALEFDDGKLILSEVTPFRPLTWDFIKATVGLPTLVQYAASARFLALVDWCNLPQATDIWQGIGREVLPLLPPADRHFFFDLADPTKKPLKAIGEVLKVISAFREHGTVTLGLNENEAVRLAEAIRQHSEKEPGKRLEEIGAFIYDHTNLTQLLVHPVNRSIVVNAQGCRTIPGRVVAKPRISTGGGDNLNAGFCYGQLAGYSVEASVLLGMATAGAYVQQGRSPDRESLISYINHWKTTL